MLQTNSSVHHAGHRFSRDFCIAVAHRGRCIFVQGCDEFRLAVVAVGDHRLVQAAEGRAWDGSAIIYVERLDDIDHEIRAALALASAAAHSRSGDRSSRGTGGTLDAGAACAAAFSVVEIQTNSRTSGGHARQKLTTLDAL